MLGEIRIGLCWGERERKAPLDYLEVSLDLRGVAEHGICDERSLPVSLEL